MLENSNTIMKFVEKWIMVVTVVVFLMHYTILKTYYGDVISDIKTYLLVAIGLLFIIKFLVAEKNQKLEWIKRKNIFIPSIVLLIIYFIFRAITIVICDFEYSVIKTVAYEGIFLIAFSKWTVTKNMKFKNIAVCFMVFVTLANIVNIWSFHYFTSNPLYSYSSNDLMLYLADFNPATNRGIIYTNPNTGGILSGMALIISFWFISKNRFKRFILMIPFWLITIYSMYILNARSSYLAILIAFASMVVLIVCKKLKPYILVTMCFILCTCITLCVYGFINYNLQDNNASLSDIENQINIETTGRYQVWQDATIAHSDKLFFGTGSYELELKERNDYLKENFIDAGGSEKDFVPTILHLHNGYLSVMMYSGLFAFMLFVFIIIDKIFEAKALKFANSKSIILAALLIYFLIINIVEPYFTGRRHIEFLFMMIILSWDKDLEEREDQYELE